MSEPAHIAAAGGVVYSYDDAGNLWLALILDKHDNWGLPKGKREGDESLAETARREIAEEIGLPPTLGAHIGQISYTVEKQDTTRRKTVEYFLAEVPHTPLTPRIEEGITRARWVSVAEASRLVTFVQVWAIVEQGVALLEAGGEPAD